MKKLKIFTVNPVLSSESSSEDENEDLRRRRCRSADETLNDKMIYNYEDNLSIIQNFAIENVINNNNASAHVADDIIVEKFVGVN